MSSRDSSAEDRLIERLAEAVATGSFQSEPSGRTRPGSGASGLEREPRLGRPGRRRRTSVRAEQGGDARAASSGPLPDDAGRRKSDCPAGHETSLALGQPAQDGRIEPADGDRRRRVGSPRRNRTRGGRCGSHRRRRTEVPATTPVRPGEAGSRPCRIAAIIGRTAPRIGACRSRQVDGLQVQRAVRRPGRGSRRGRRRACPAGRRP